MMDFAIFAIAFNVLKLHRKSGHIGKNPSESQKATLYRLFFAVFIPSVDNRTKLENMIREKPACAV